MSALVVESPTAAAGVSRAGRRSRTAWLREPGMGATILVGAISAAFGVVLLSATEYIAALVRAQPGIGGAATVQVTLAIATTVLVGLSIYVGAIVTTNTFSTVVAGRTRGIALLRLLGSTARRERTALARRGLALGALGAAAGLLGGLAVSVVGLRWVSETWGLRVDWVVLRLDLAAPVLAVVVVTWASAWIGSRRVGTVTPLQALSNATEATRDDVRGRRGRNTAAALLVVVGAGLLSFGIVAGGMSSSGFLAAFVGGALSFSGIALGASLYMPPVLRATGALFGRSAVARMAAANALRHSERSSRMAIGVTMGVTLVTMFAVASATSTRFFDVVLGEQVPPELALAIDVFTGVMMGLVGVSAVIAAVGVVNLLTLGILQRRRELGLLRALGLSARQVRTMVVLEAAHVVITAVVMGLLLGTLYGWAGAQSLFGWMPAAAGIHDGPAFVAPAVPVATVGVIVAATLALTLVASIVPARLATRLGPVDSLSARP